MKVYFKRDRGLLLLKSEVDGRVIISRELVKPDRTIPEVLKEFEIIDPEDPIYKLTFNVVPFEMSKNFELINEI